MRSKSLFLLFAILCCLGYAKSSAETPYPLSVLGIEKGLSNNSVRCIFKDSKGLMWFGTHDGLNRFDGYEIKIFRSRLGDDKTLPHNYIYAIAEDRNQNLWVGTGQGIAIYNSLSASFDPIFFRSTGNQKRIQLKTQVNTIKSLSNGDVVVGTNGAGLLIKPYHQQNAIQIPLPTAYKNNVAYNVVDIKLLNSGEIYLFIEAVGLCRYDLKSQKIILEDTVIKSANCIETDGKSKVWISCPSGIYTYQIKSRELNIFTDHRKLSNAALVLRMYWDRSNTLWTGTKGEGVKLLNATTGTAISSELTKATHNQSIPAIFRDQEKRMWIGTSKDGVVILNPRNSVFRTISNNPNSTNTLVNNYAAAFYEQPNGKLWIGTDGGGISIWDRTNNTFKNLVASSKPGSLSNNAVSNIKQDNQGQIWVATYGGGINKFIPSDFTFKKYRCINTADNRENENVWQLFEDRKKMLWAVTFAHGTLYYLDRAKDAFVVFDEKIQENLLAITEDRYGMMWGGNASDLIKIDRTQRKYTHVNVGKPVRVVLEDSYGNFWIGSEGAGLMLFDRKNMKVLKRFTTDQGLCNNAILSMVESNGYLWISTFSGLAKFEIGTHKFTNFFQEDGLQSNQFLDNASLKLKSGELVFGGLKGFSIFNPDSILNKGITPPLLITNLRVDNHDISYHEDKNLITGVNDNRITEITIPFNKASVSVDFAALEYGMPGKISYSYYMEGWDKGWTFANKLRNATYTRLTEGIYKLRIKSTTTAGSWANNECVLTIRVLPPWYRSWWAYLGYAFSIIGGIYVFLNYQKKQTLLKYEVDLANLKVQQEKDLSENKLSFFTHISHEFRTPLTLIINPIKEFLNNKDSQVDPKELVIVYRNARRLLSLVDQLLSFRKSETQALKVAKFELVSFCKDVFECFVQQARAKGIGFKMVCDAEAIEIYGDQEKLEIVLFNLIANAFKFTPQGGTITLKIAESADQILINLSDTGSGISEEAGAKIFERFYQGANRPSVTGFGIGLFLVKKLVEAHFATVSYESEKGKGTDFQLKLQKGKEHFKNVSIEESTVMSPITHYQESEILLDSIFDEDAFQKDVPSQNHSLPDHTTEKKVILIVEDNLEIRTYIKKIFEPNYLVYEADGGDKGYLLVKKYLPDIIITDVVMEGGSGLDLCINVKSDAELNHIPVIMLTSSSSSEIKLKGIEQGADDFITKPFEKEILIARVANLLKSRNTLQQYFLNEITLKSDDFKISPEYKDFLERCIKITEKHLDDPNFSVKTLADELAISTSLLYKKVKSISGKTTNEFIRYIRLRKAAQLFINSNFNVNQTAMHCGFNDIKYFREQFYKVFAERPSDYIKKYRKNLSDKHRVNRDF